MRVRLTLEPDDRICLESPYDAAFVESLKRALDYGGRQWEPTRRRWLISALYAEELLAFLRQYGCQIHDDRTPAHSGMPTPLPPMPEDLRLAFDVLHLAYTAPLCVADASYRALSKYYHPDHGGDVTLFHAITDAIAVVRSHLDPKDPIPF
jgi:hypothetical protein